ncbi:bifunctional folylpolyglutamate synthase/dihydrofolate synthase [bacterium]|nr:bifunctional folylpolyglutamate synthase/dihydrofolate synthase [bacterium]
MTDNLFSENKKIIDLTLERVSRVLEYFNNPQNSFKSIHIAGTNGKGSTANIINSTLMNVSACKKVGLYTSPHLFSYFERIKINNENISENVFLSLKKEVEDASDKLKIELTEFEILTAICFLYFAREQVDIAIVEVGLGGRFDATNVISRPLCSAIASISLDHTEKLGDTLERVAYEKAGIIKTATPVVISKSNKGYSAVLNVANQKSAEIFNAREDIEIIKENGKNFALIGKKLYEFGLEGVFQAQNLALALKALEVLPFEVTEDALARGLRNVKWRFRAQFIKDKNLLIDGCHNPDGARVLREYLDKNFANYKIRFIWGSLKHKDYNSVLDNLVRTQDELYLYEFDYPNALKHTDLDENYRARFKITENPFEIINNTEESKLTVVCGSLYMLGNLFKECEIEGL